MVLFDPGTLHDTAVYPPKMALTGLRVGNEDVVPGPESPLAVPIRLAEEMRLTYDQRDFTINYVALSFRQPEKVQYHYKLDGYDTEWVSARTQRSARYSGLRPGSYTFRVRAIDNRGRRSESDATVRITMLPPWWRMNFVNNFAGLNEELTGELLEEIKANPEMPAREMEEVITSLKVNASRIARHGRRADEIVASMMQHAVGESERYEVAINPLVSELINITYSSVQSQKPDLEVAIEKNLDESAGSLTIAPQEIGRAAQYSEQCPGCRL